MMTRNRPTGILPLSSVGLFLLLIATGKAYALEPDGNIAIRLPRGVQLRNVTIAATGSIDIGTRSVVSGPTAAVGSVANVGPGQTQVGANANVQTNLISVPQAFLGNNARIGGSLLTAKAPSLNHGAIVAGGVIERDQFLKPTYLAWMPPTPVAGSDFMLKPHATDELRAGAYANVTIFPNAKVTLGAGVYQINSLDLKSQATLTFDNRNGPIIIYITSTLIMKGTVELLGSASDLGIIYESTTATAIETTFSGTIVAPYAQLRLSANGSRQLNGQFIGQSIVIDPDVQVIYTPFHWDVIQPFFGAGNGIAGRLNTSTLIHSTPAACFAPSFDATTQVFNGDTVYTSLAFANPTPSQGVCTPQFCDEDGNPVPGPSEAQLNSAPPPGSSCPAIWSIDNCPVDATSLTILCVSDADCGSDGVCAARCVDAGCTNIEHRCGKPATTCTDLPAEANCDEFRLCPTPGATGTPDPQVLAQQLAPTTSPNASGQIPPDEQDTPPADYARVTGRMLCSPAPLADEESLHDESSKSAQDGSSQWGIFLEPVTSFKINPFKRTDGIGEITLEAHGGFRAGGILFGNKIEAFKAELNTTVDDCGVTLTGDVKLFGEAIVVWSPSAGQAFHLATDNSGGSLATPNLDRDTCKTARKNTKNAIIEARKANLFARAVRQYYLEHGLTPSLCSEIQYQLGEKAVKDPTTGQSYHCYNSNQLGEIQPVDRIKIINAWKDEYDGSTGKYVDFSKDLKTAQQAIQTSGTIDVFKDPHPYNVVPLEADLPIGPVMLNLAVEGFGSWNIAGGIQFGVGVDGNFDNATAILANSLQGQAPRVGDIRIFGGPVITPALQVGVLAFVGVGIPGISVGIQGQIDLLDVSLPSGIVGAAMRLSEPDPRSLIGTDYEGTPIVGMESNVYRWVTGYNWSSKLQLSELKGELDLALRIHFLFFKHTFKFKLFSWPGLTQTFPLVSGGVGDTLAFTGDYGKQADDVAYTTPVQSIDNPPNVTNDTTLFGCPPPPIN